MNVGYGCVISDKWIPESAPTGLLDNQGNPLKTRDTVTLTGCTSDTAVIGFNSKGEVMLYFGSKNGSIGWRATEETIKKNKVTLKKSL